MHKLIYLAATIIIILQKGYSSELVLNSLYKTTNHNISSPVITRESSSKWNYNPSNSDLSQKKYDWTSRLNLELSYIKGDWKNHTNWTKFRSRQANMGEGVTIGIIDSLINCNHKNLKTTSYRTCISEYSREYESTFNTSKGWDHGSNAAGVAAGTGGYGVAPRANIHGFAIFDAHGQYVPSSRLEDVVEYLVEDKGSKVINMSFNVPYSPLYDYLPANSYEAEAVREAKGKALVVKAAGNGFNGIGRRYATYKDDDIRRNVLRHYYNNLLIVGAIDSTGKIITPWSDRPGEGCAKGKLENKCNYHNKWKNYFIVAPGYVNTTAGEGNGSQNAQGTSFSAPIVSGTAALIQSRWPQLKPHQIRNILLRTATDLGKRGADGIYGRGALNITRALKPVRGKVGGVRVNKASTDVYTRLSYLGDFSKDVQIIDVFGRDFEAVNYSTLSGSPVIHSLSNNQFSFYISDATAINGYPSINFDGFTIGKFTHFNSLSIGKPFTDFRNDENPLDRLPSTLITLNQNNQAIIVEDSNNSYFAMTSHNNSKNESDVTTIGMKKNQHLGKNKILSSTVAFIDEKGFHGLSSQDKFGFENKNNSLYFEIGYTQSTDENALHFNVNHHQTFDNYSSQNISWNNVGITELQAEYSLMLDDSYLNLRVSSGYMLSGELESSINGLDDLSDYYNKDPIVAVRYTKKSAFGGTTNFDLSSEDKGSIFASFKFNF